MVLTQTKVDNSEHNTEASLVEWSESMMHKLKMHCI
jgi:hypothetical protein